MDLYACGTIFSAADVADYRLRFKSWSFWRRTLSATRSRAGCTGTTHLGWRSFSRRGTWRWSLAMSFVATIHVHLQPVRKESSATVGAWFQSFFVIVLEGFFVVIFHFVSWYFSSNHIIKVLRCLRHWSPFRFGLLAFLCFPFFDTGLYVNFKTWSSEFSATDIAD